jgi:hypothetical protein
MGLRVDGHTNRVYDRETGQPYQAEAVLLAASLTALKAVESPFLGDVRLLAGRGLYRYDDEATDPSDDEFFVRPAGVASDAEAGRWVLDAVPVSRLSELGVPLIALVLSATSGAAPLTITVSLSGTLSDVAQAFYFVDDEAGTPSATASVADDGDGTSDWDASITFTEAGTYQPFVRVKLTSGRRLEFYSTSTVVVS